jgi:alpha-mannosidase
LSDADGNPVPVQQIQPEAGLHAWRVLFPVTVPAGGHLQLLVRDDAPPAGTQAATDLAISPARLVNGQVEVELDGSGVRALRYQGRDLLGGRGIRFHLREDNTDTWGFTTDRFSEPVTDELAGLEWVVEETGPLRGRVRAEGWLGRSRVRWTLSLEREAPRLELAVEVVFAERHRLLQLPIHLAGEPARWTDGLAGGWIERTPNPAEWPVLGWSRIDVGGAALALVTQDAYSLSLDGEVWQWTLLRSPRMAWSGTRPEVYLGHDHHTDQGAHAFRLALHVGGPAELSEAGLETAARQLVQRPVVFDRYEGLQRPPWGSQPPRLLWTEAENRAFADGRLCDLPGDDPTIRPPT